MWWTRLEDVKGQAGHFLFCEGELRACKGNCTYISVGVYIYIYIYSCLYIYVYIYKYIYIYICVYIIYICIYIYIYIYICIYIYIYMCVCVFVCVCVCIYIRILSRRHGFSKVSSNRDFTEQIQQQADIWEFLTFENFSVKHFALFHGVCSRRDYLGSLEENSFGDPCGVLNVYLDMLNVFKRRCSCIRCSVLQFVAGCCSVLQCIQRVSRHVDCVKTQVLLSACVAVCCSVTQSVTVWLCAHGVSGHEICCFVKYIPKRGVFMCIRSSMLQWDA